jgi:heptose I phosphotransferase
LEKSVEEGTIEIIESGNIIINAAFAKLLKINNLETIEKIYNLQGETVKKAVKQRGTERVFLTDKNDQPIECYIKRCTAIPFKEKIKCLLQLKRWNFNTLNEWHALVRFHEVGLNTMLPIAAGYLQNGSNCLLTLGLTGCVRASDFFNDESICRETRLKAIDNIAVLTATMHNNGMTHQDLYMVHFFIRPSEDYAAYMIDLQRVIFASPPKRRWHIKDLGQLTFAASKLLNQEEMIRLQKTYRQNCTIDRVNDPAFVKAVEAKATKIDKHDQARARRRATAQK